VPRIRAGSARSYFLWLEDESTAAADAASAAAAPAHADAARAPAQAICLLPHGQATGVVQRLPQVFALRLGEPVRFQLLASSLPTPWRAGQLVDVAALDAVWLPPLIAQMPLGAEDALNAEGGAAPLSTHLSTQAARPRPTPTQVRVQLQAGLSEIGTLDVACVAVSPAGDGAPGAASESAPARWPLVFAVRGAQAAHGEWAQAGDAATPAEDAHAVNAANAVDAAGRARAAGVPAPKARIAPPWAAVSAQATALIDEVFGDAAQQLDAGTVRRLRQRLERLLGPRDAWPVALLRPLFDVLMARARRRRRSAEHERVWLNLAGYCLRPGLGEPRDAQRMASLWALHDEGLSYPKGKGNWAEWWVCWRRVAAGLSQPQHMALMSGVAGAMEHADQRHLAADSPLVAYDDMVRLVAVLENLSAAYRAELGEWLMQRLARPGEGAQTWWALGRTGSRVPLHGSPHNVVGPELIAPWLQAALAQDWRRNDSAMFAAVQMARMTGDRARDVDEATRAQVLQGLQRAKAPERWQRMVSEVLAMDAGDVQRSAGEALPPGLRLLAG
jgi:hypothetical protein